MCRQEPKLSDAFQKDTDDENFLRRLNEILAPYQEADYKELPETFPTLHIVGAPRSGTTLLHQVIAAHLDIGYINNLIASFWQAPTYGIRLSKKLMPKVSTSSFESEFGRTSGVHEPHEFGYFWSSMLGYKEMLERDSHFEENIDWARLRTVLINMSHAFDRPVVFKPFLLVWHVAKMQEIMPKSCFVWIKRDPVQTALSLVTLRRKYVGSINEWAGLKPVEYAWLKDEPYWTQVAGQVVYVERAIQRQVDQMNGHNVLTIDYEAFTEDPAAVLSDIRDMLGKNGFRPDMKSDPPTGFSTRIRTRDDAEDYDRIEREIARLTDE